MVPAPHGFHCVRHSKRKRGIPFPVCPSRRRVTIRRGIFYNLLLRRCVHFGRSSGRRRILLGGQALFHEGFTIVALHFLVAGFLVAGSHPVLLCFLFVFQAGTHEFLALVAFLLGGFGITFLHALLLGFLLFAGLFLRFFSLWRISLYCICFRGVRFFGICFGRLYLRRIGLCRCWCGGWCGDGRRSFLGVFFRFVLCKRQW